MIQVLSGKVESYRAITKYNVQLSLSGTAASIQLHVSTPWVVNRGDTVVVAGEFDQVTGKFIAGAYRNKSRGVFDHGPIAGNTANNLVVAVCVVLALVTIVTVIFPMVFIFFAFLFSASSRRNSRSNRFVKDCIAALK